MSIEFTEYNTTIEYEPTQYLGSLHWFHIAECARKRMHDNCGDINRWRGERRSFYSALRMMNIDSVVFMDK